MKSKKLIFLAVILFLSVFFLTFTKIFIYKIKITKTDHLKEKSKETVDISSDDDNIIITDNNKEINNSSISSIDKKNSEKIDTSKSNNQKENLEKKENLEIKKHTCTENDVLYVEWKKDYLTKYSTIRLFDSLEDSKKKAEEIMYNYYYGYTASTTPIIYSDNNCEKKHYSLEIFVPQGICENNPVVWIPNNIDIEKENINTVKYLKKIGYECANKKVD